MKQKKITSTMQEVAVDILEDFEILVMTNDGPYTFEEIWEIVQKHVDGYGLYKDPFTNMICTSDEWAKNSLKYEKQVAIEKYGHCDWLE